MPVSRQAKFWLARYKLGGRISRDKAMYPRKRIGIRLRAQPPAQSGRPLELNYTEAATPSMRRAYSSMVLSLIPNLSTTGAMSIASPCR